MKHFLKTLFSGLWKILLCGGAFLTLLDQLTKIYAKNALSGGPAVLIEGVFQFTYAENRGAAFSLFQNQQVLFVVLGVLFLGISAYVFEKLSGEKAAQAVLVLLFAGALGNLIDRVRLGYVIDFLDFCLIRFPVFNAADSMITVGAALFFGFSLFQKGFLERMDRRLFGTEKDHG